MLLLLFSIVVVSSSSIAVYRFSSGGGGAGGTYGNRLSGHRPLVRWNLRSCPREGRDRDLVDGTTGGAYEDCVVVVWAG